MSVERHYDDEALIALLGNPAAEAAARTEHLSSCASCSETLASYRLMTSLLREQAMWDAHAPGEASGEASGATIRTLRDSAGAMAREDEEAVALVNELLEGPRETWMPRLRAGEKYRQPGVVRKLLETGTSVIYTMPPDASAITALAVEIAEGLDPAVYGAETVARLRGAAWRDHGYALYYVGSFTEARTAAERAATALEGATCGDYDLARVAIVRALVERALEHFDEALRLAAFALEVFERAGDLERVVSAALTHSQLLMSRGEFQSAIGILERLEGRSGGAGDVANRGRVLANLAYCYRMTGRIDEAPAHFELAAGIFDGLGMASEAARLRWNVAALLLQQGRLDDAEPRLRAVRRELSDLGMTSEATISTLDLSELLLAKGRFEEVEMLCGEAMARFRESGLAYSARALTALGFIREAAAERRATAGLMSEVRIYLRRLPEEPQLLFAPALLPDSPDAGRDPSRPVTPQ